MPARLTEKQDHAYEFIRSFLRERGKPPTLHEIGAALGIRSVSSVHKLIGALEQKGYVRREPNIARGLMLTDDAGGAGFGFGPPSVILASSTSSRTPEQLRRRPLGSVYVDPRLLGGADPDACLIAAAGDDGMATSGGIHKGDFLVIEETAWANLRREDIAAALVGERLVARRHEFLNGRHHLRAGDRRYVDDVFAPGDVGYYLVGRVLAVMRKA